MIIFKPVKRKKSIELICLTIYLYLNLHLKVKAIVDVPLTDFNSDFMIDNFQPKNILGVLCLEQNLISYVKEKLKVRI